MTSPTTHQRQSSSDARRFARSDRGWTARTETQEAVTVAGYQAIGEVSQTLVAMLQDRLREHWNAQLDDKVILTPPTVADEDTRPWLTLYLYHVEANAHRSNAPRRGRSATRRSRSISTTC